MGPTLPRSQIHSLIYRTFRVNGHHRPGKCRHEKKTQRPGRRRKDTDLAVKRRARLQRQNTGPQKKTQTPLSTVHTLFAVLHLEEIRRNWREDKHFKTEKLNNTDNDLFTNQPRPSPELQTDHHRSHLRRKFKRRGQQPPLWTPHGQYDPRTVDSTAKKSFFPQCSSRVQLDLPSSWSATITTARRGTSVPAGATSTKAVIRSHLKQVQPAPCSLLEETCDLCVRARIFSL